MLLTRYEEQQRLTNTNLKGKTTRADCYAYRGDLVLEEGEVADAQGRRKPPISVFKQAALLATSEKLVFIAGFLDKIEYLPLFVEKYGADFADDVRCVLFVENIADPIQVEYQGVCYAMIPLIEGTGMVWNELADLLGLEKSDFKGQSAEDKLITVYESFVKDFTPKFPKLGYEDAVGKTILVKKEDRGPV